MGSCSGCTSTPPRNGSTRSLQRKYSTRCYGKRHKSDAAGIAAPAHDADLVIGMKCGPEKYTGRKNDRQDHGVPSLESNEVASPYSLQSRPLLSMNGIEEASLRQGFEHGCMERTHTEGLQSDRIITRCAVFRAEELRKPCLASWGRLRQLASVGAGPYAKSAAAIMMSDCNQVNNNTEGERKSECANLPVIPKCGTGQSCLLLGMDLDLGERPRNFDLPEKAMEEDLQYRNSHGQSSDHKNFVSARSTYSLNNAPALGFGRGVVHDTGQSRTQPGSARKEEDGLAATLCFVTNPGNRDQHKPQSPLSPLAIDTRYSVYARAISSSAGHCE